MPYVYLDAPADSSELDTYRGYQVSRLVLRAVGGPQPPRAFIGPDELVLDLPPAGSFAVVPAATVVRRGRRVPVQTRWQRPLVPNYLLASWLMVPALCGLICGLMPWLVGHVGP
jgi:hypothetical protein